MSLSAKIRRAPLRLSSGAFILNAGLGKLKADDATAGQLHGMAAGTYPFLAKVDPKVFVKGLAVSEIALGSLLLAPIIPAGLAGIALTGFGGSLLGLYLKTPGMTKEGSVAPTQQGTAIAKDAWLTSMGVALVLDAALSESRITDDARDIIPIPGH
ncbi:hypothetical protein ACXR2U_20580 [Jatrophihabitans sp. YIM 134969]